MTEKLLDDQFSPGCAVTRRASNGGLSASATNSRVWGPAVLTARPANCCDAPGSGWVDIPLSSGMSGHCVGPCTARSIDSARATYWPATKVSGATGDTRYDQTTRPGWAGPTGDVPAKATTNDMSPKIG